MDEITDEERTEDTTLLRCYHCKKPTSTDKLDQDHRGDWICFSCIDGQERQFQSFRDREDRD